MEADRPRPAQPLRWLLAAVVLVLVASLLYLVLAATDAALAVWSQLGQLPAWVGVLVGLLLLAFVAGGGWLIWRLLRPAPPRQARAATIDRAALEARLERVEQLGGAPARGRAELLELDRRRAAGVIHIAVFGTISAGKSSLIAALLPAAQVEVDVRGGSTRDVQIFEGEFAGHRLRLADVPGIQQVGGERHADLARAEAARAHALLFVVEAEPTRSEDAELRELARFGRPLVLALNKIDRHGDADRQALLTALGSRYAELGVSVLQASAGSRREVVREWPDGRREPAEVTTPAQVDALRNELVRIAELGHEQLEPARESAVLSGLDRELATAETQLRAEQAEAIVRRYTRRAVVGAMAAIAPGSDLVIQGALATAMTRDLARLHDLPVRDVDLDALLGRASNLLRTSTSVVLAVVGNGLKAFPGLGTLGGGLVHAVAYGLIFDSLGRALAQTLAHTRELDREATLDAFKASLERPAAERLRMLAGMAMEAINERSSRQRE